ncbi:3-hydroxybutyrate dehydrogenase [Natronoarchaeum philippinense]|uniref:3-hydroxybutyrate dehydrogenase n=1 Tax=Natronoarchaeum philippinense TaxID=558529 RepID=A0A285NBP2_NATPI|nr:SDR family oxidoreductase [Natronoarchaeum philippinense]SNZ06850.1 3-hydroxybutyrate dehydrogenase [Natronoarchaeum philippinense]
MGEDITPPEVEREDIHTIDDDRFAPESVCLVTGAASGIGRAVALSAAANGLTVAATDIDEDGLDGTAQRAAAMDAEGAIETVPTDLRNDAEMDALVDAATELGDLRFLANVAGLQHVDPIEEFPMDAYDEIQDVMVRAPTYLAKRCLPHMREAGGGCVGNMASVHGHYVTSDKVAYNVAKFGLRGLTQSIAAEGDGDVRSFSVSTGYVKTPLVTGQIPDTAEQRGISEREVVEDVMLGQSRQTEMLAPVEVGNLFLFGFSELARHLNGGDLLFDGGMTLTYA